jgi:flagellar biosynthetic protein FliR
VLVLTTAQIEGWIAGVFWPFLRIGACLMVAPVFGAQYVTPRIRIVLAGALTLMALPLLPPPPVFPVLSADGIVTTIQQLLIGVALGFLLQLMFDALTLGGQILANGMGLEFAYNLDPLRGVQAPTLGQFYSLIGTLVFLALDGHVALIETLVESFRGLPVGPVGLSPAELHQMANWGGQLFAGALRVALPGMTALLVVNLAFGVTSRAAPALNLFAVGFPITLVFGLVIVLLSLPVLQGVVRGLIDGAFLFMRALTGG